MQLLVLQSQPQKKVFFVASQEQQALLSAQKALPVGRALYRLQTQAMPVQLGSNLQHRLLPGLGFSLIRCQPILTVAVE